MKTENDNDLVIAPWYKRLTAYFLDVLLLITLQGIVLAFLGSSSTFIQLFINMLLIWPYFILLPLRKDHPGQTLGKQLQKIKVVNDNGQPLSWQQIFSREGLRWIIIFLASGFTSIALISGHQTVVNGHMVNSNRGITLLCLFIIILWVIFDDLISPWRSQQRKTIHDKIAKTTVINF
jgi:uncharacterized RDD family membrane protein YckC